MSVYTVTADLLRNLHAKEGSAIYIADVLFVFTNTLSSHKVAKDKYGESIKNYNQINDDTIKTWLDLMSYQPSQFEEIDVDVRGYDEKHVFLKICKETMSENKIIFYSKQSIYGCDCQSNLIEYEGKKLTVMDRDDVRRELNLSPNTISITSSVIASNGSKISEVEFNK